MEITNDSRLCAYIARINTSFIDVPDRIAVAIFFAGCSIRCPACQNKSLWERSSGSLYTLEAVLAKINHNPLADSVVFLGGEPTDQGTFLGQLIPLIKGKARVLYTGREFEVLLPEITENLEMIVCGPYRADLAVRGWPASSNQRVFERKGTSWLQRTI